MSITVRNDQWFFDDSGYYCYVLVNGTEEEYQHIRHALAEGGVRILRRGRSYRPASNGIQYRWFIRIESATCEQVEQALRPITVTAEDRARERAYLRTREEIGAVEEQARQTAREWISSFEVDWVDLGKKYKESLGKLRESQQQADRLRSELAQSQKIIQELRNEIRQLQTEHESEKLRLESLLTEAHQETEELASIRERYERNIEREKGYREKQENEYMGLFNSQDKELVELRRELHNVRAQNDTLMLEQLRLSDELQGSEHNAKTAWTQYQQLQAKNSELTELVEEFRAEPVQQENSGSAKKLFRDVVRVLLPEIEFLRNSLDLLWDEMENPVAVLRELSKLGKPGTKGKRIAGTEDWLERKLGSVRLYWQKRTNNAHFRVLVSFKPMQEEDILWIKKQ